jgi:hypothetical protein
VKNPNIQQPKLQQPTESKEARAKIKHNKPFTDRSNKIADSYEVSASELSDSLPAFKNDFAIRESRKIRLQNVELFNGYKGNVHQRVKNINLDSPIYGNTYNTNLPEQAYTYEYPSFNEGVFNPLQMHLTGRANYDRMSKGGTLPITPLPDTFNPSNLLKSRRRFQ